MCKMWLFHESRYSPPPGERQKGGHGEGGVVAAAEGARGELGAGQGARAGEKDGGAETAPVAG